MGGLIAVAYGAASYLAFLMVFVYTVGFIADFGVPKSIDSGSTASPVQAVIVDLLLLGLFALQHSAMARPAFKRWWVRLVPKSVERSTYVLAASLCLALLLWQWQPLPALVWRSKGAGAEMLWALYALGWVLVLVSTFLISHTHLFGLQQVSARFRGHPPCDPPFRVEGLYRYVRHPIMFGFVIVFWSAPAMSWGRLLFAAAGTAYIVVALRFEEHDLVAHFGQRYRDYRARVPMLLPRPGRMASVREAAAFSADDETGRIDP